MTKPKRELSKEGYPSMSPVEKTPVGYTSPAKWYIKHLSWNVLLTAFGVACFAGAVLLFPYSPERYYFYAVAGVITVVAGFPFDVVRALVWKPKTPIMKEG